MCSLARAYRSLITFTSTLYRNDPIRIRRALSLGGRRRNLQRTSSLPRMPSCKPSCDKFGRVQRQTTQAAGVCSAVPVRAIISPKASTTVIGRTGCPVYDYYYLGMKMKEALIIYAIRIHCPRISGCPSKPQCCRRQYCIFAYPRAAPRPTLCALVLDVVAAGSPVTPNCFPFLRFILSYARYRYRYEGRPGMWPCQARHSLARHTPLQTMIRGPTFAPASHCGLLIRLHQA